MNYYSVVQICLALLLLFTMVTGRALQYDQSDEEDNSNLLAYETEANEDDNSKFRNVADVDTNNEEVDSYEERKFYERSIFSTLRPPHFISARTREALIDLLQKAVDQGWRPSLKHYNPSTRFGRHRR